MGVVMNYGNSSDIVYVQLLYLNYLSNCCKSPPDRVIWTMARNISNIHKKLADIGSSVVVCIIFVWELFLFVGQLCTWLYPSFHLFS